MVQKLIDKVDDVNFIFNEIRDLVVGSRNKVYIYVNVKFILAYWKDYNGNTRW